VALFHAWLPDDTADLRAFYPTSLLISGYDILFFLGCPHDHDESAPDESRSGPNEPSVFPFVRSICTLWYAIPKG